MGAVGFAFSDVLCDAVMVEKGQPLNATDRLQSAQWGAIAGASIILAFVGGYIAEWMTFQEAILLSVVFPAAVIVVTLLFLKEKKATSISDSATKAWRGVKEALAMKKIWGCVIFLFLFNLSPSIGTALYNYQIDILHFSQIDIGHIRTVEGFGFLAGTAVFAGVFHRLSERAMLSSIIILGVLSTLAFLFYKDLNIHL